MLLPSLILLITKEASLENVKNQHLFLTRLPAIVKIPHGNSSFQSNNSDVAALRKHVREHWITLPSATHLIESKVKCTSFCSSTGESEVNASNNVTIRSVSMPQAASNLKSNPDFKNRKRRKKNAKDFLHRHQCETEAFTGDLERRK